MSTCLWYDEDFEEDRAHQSTASGCTKEATHHSCCWVGDASKPNVCEEHKCRCKQPTRIDAALASIEAMYPAAPMPGVAVEGSPCSCGEATCFWCMRQPKEAGPSSGAAKTVFRVQEATGEFQARGPWRKTREEAKADFPAASSDDEASFRAGYKAALTCGEQPVAQTELSAWKRWRRERAEPFTRKDGEP